MTKETTKKRQISYDIEGHGEVVFEQPERSVYMRLLSQLQDDKTDPAVALLAFAKSCLASGPFDAVVDDYPAFINQSSSDLQDLARPAAQAIVKKG